VYHIRPQTLPHRDLGIVAAFALFAHSAVKRWWAHRWHADTVYSRSPEKTRTRTVAKEFQIGLYDPAEADLELFSNSWSAGFLGERLYLDRWNLRNHVSSLRNLPMQLCALETHIGISRNIVRDAHIDLLPSAAGPKPSSRARMLFGVLGRTDNLQTALGLCQGCFFPERSPKSSVRRDRCISTRKKRDTA